MSRSEDLSRFAGDARFSDRILCLKQASGLAQPQPTELKTDRDSDAKVLVESLDPNDNARQPEENVGFKRLPVNSMLLASKSRFFEALFTVGMSETTQQELEFEAVDRAEAERVEAIILFMYSSKLPDHWKGTNFIEAMLLCDRLGYDSALLACCSALEKELTIDLCSSILALPETLLRSESCSQLVTACERRLVDEFRNFELYALSEKFRNLSPEAAYIVLKSDKILVQSEQSVFSAACMCLSRYAEKLTSNCPKKKREIDDEDGCTYGYPCPSCLAKVSSASSMFLHCLRLPTFSANFLHDVVKDSLFMDMSTPCPSLSFPNGRPRSVREVFELMYQEAVDWQRCSEQRQNLTLLATSILDIRLPLSPSSSPKVCDRQIPLPSRFVKRSAPPDGDEKSVEYGDGVMVHSRSYGSAYAYPSGAGKVMRWRIPKVVGVKEKGSFSSPSFGVEGYPFSLTGIKAKKNDHDQDHCFDLMLRLRPPQSRAAMFLLVSWRVTAKNWSTNKMDRLWFNNSLLFSGEKIWLHCRPDLFKKTWNELMASDYVDESGAIEIEVHVRILE